MRMLSGMRTARHHAIATGTRMQCIRWPPISTRSGGHGVDIRSAGPRTAGADVPNNPSFTKRAEESAKVMNAELATGRWLGPFICPTDVFLQTPMAMVEQSDKYRHITNATMGVCLNEYIADPSEPLRLTTHKETQRRIHLMAGARGTHGLWMAKRDIKSAYRNLAIRPEDSEVAGVKIAGRYYLDTALNFGTRSSPTRSASYLAPWNGC